MDPARKKINHQSAVTDVINATPFEITDPKRTENAESGAPQQQPEAEELQSNGEDSDKQAAEDLQKKNQQDLKQQVYTDLMREMAHDRTSQTISYENLTLLLFMT